MSARLAVEDNPVGRAAGSARENVVDDLPDEVRDSVPVRGPHPHLHTRSEAKVVRLFAQSRDTCERAIDRCLTIEPGLLHHLFDGVRLGPVSDVR